MNTEMANVHKIIDKKQTIEIKIRTIECDVHISSFCFKCTSTLFSRFANKITIYCFDIKLSVLVFYFIIHKKNSIYIFLARNYYGGPSFALMSYSLNNKFSFNFNNMYGNGWAFE